MLKENKEGYIKSKIKSILKLEVAGYRVGYVFGEEHISELGNNMEEALDDIG